MDSGYCCRTGAPHTDKLPNTAAAAAACAPPGATSGTKTSTSSAPAPPVAPPPCPVSARAPASLAARLHTAATQSATCAPPDSHDVRKRAQYGGSTVRDA
eukprot:724906-Prorocentrum_minimum.AAC.1